MPRHSPHAARPLVGLFGLTVVGTLLLAWGEPRASGRPGAPVASGADDPARRVADTIQHGPGPAPVDFFHPEHQPGPDGERPALPAPAYGGRVAIHVNSVPSSLCYPIDGATDTRNILFEVHETLMRYDWETWAWVPTLVARRVVEDTVVLVGGERLFGRVEELDGALRIVPTSPGNPLAEARTVALGDVEAVHGDTVYTYVLRDDVSWHPVAGFEQHPLDAHDVAFSFSIYANPHVRCGEKRQQFERIRACDVVDERTVRFHYTHTFFDGDESAGGMTILPSHLYDLGDPDHANHDPHATAERQGREINENPRNLDWVGLGPYRVTSYSSREVVAERFDGYFDAERAGYVDEIRWKAVADGTAAYQALLDGELDFSSRLSAAQFLGDAQEPVFAERFTTGWAWRGTYGAVVWNLHRPQLGDPVVRRAIAHAFDFEDFRQAQYKGLAWRVTGPMPFFSSAYDAELEPPAFDPARAAALLTEGGWYDRDGDGVRDKDGVALTIEYLMPTGSLSSRRLGLKLQEDLARLGIRFTLHELEWAAVRERHRRREFDASPMGWTPPLEVNPEQLWHSSGGGADVESSNHSGLQDPEIDRLIERGLVETDRDARMATWRALHARLAELQPFLFLYNVPMKFALRRDLRGFQAVKIEPCYVVRRWYYPRGTPGTRPTRAR